MNRYKYLILPGLGNSGANHWQSFWETSLNNCDRVIQDNWDAPDKEKWLHRVNSYIEESNEPTILIAHSLSVSLVAHWNKTYQNSNVLCAMLVAPADVDSPKHTPEVLRSFAPIPKVKLSFPSVVVASENDPYVDFERAKYFADKWGSEFKNVGRKGHINAESKLENWTEGLQILEEIKNANTV